MNGLSGKRVVITGLGVVSPFGFGKEALWNGLCQGGSAIKEITRFPTVGLRSNLAAEIQDFKPQELLGPKGLRLLDRTTLFALCAARLAFADAGVEISAGTADDIGVALGSTMGSLASRFDFFLEVVKNGPMSVNPAVFPNVVANSPASQISIRSGIRGFNTTVSTGFTSSLDAMEYAANCIALDKASLVLTGGVEELSECGLNFLHRVGFLAGSKGDGEVISAPFDRRRNGVVPGEGGALMIMEDLDHARARGAHIYAEYRGGGSALDMRAWNRYSPRAEGAVKSIRKALQRSAIEGGAIDYVAAGANSTLLGDAAEVRALKTIFGGGNGPAVSAVKSIVGETFSASGAFQVASALMSLARGVIAPTIGFREPDGRCLIDCVLDEAREQKVRNILITSFSPMAKNSACVVSAFSA